MFWGTDEIGTRIHFFNDKDEIKEFVKTSGYFINQTGFDNKERDRALKNIEKISFDYDNSLTITNVLHKMSAIGRKKEEIKLKK